MLLPPTTSTVCCVDKLWSNQEVLYTHKACHRKPQYIRVKVKVKFSRTRYRALGPEMIPVYCTGSQPAGDVK